MESDMVVLMDQLSQLLESFQLFMLLFFPVLIIVLVTAAVTDRKSR